LSNKRLWHAERAIRKSGGAASLVNNNCYDFAYCRGLIVEFLSGVELIAGDVEAFHCGFADLDAILVGAHVERAFEFQTGLGRRRTDQLFDVPGG
jgi:hypothetical protein